MIPQNKGWSGGATVLSKFSVPVDNRRAKSLLRLQQVLVRVVWIFFSLVYLFSLLSPSVADGPI